MQKLISFLILLCVSLCGHLAHALSYYETGRLLDAIRCAESQNGRLIVSPAGAYGPYQMLPATAAEVAQKSETPFKYEDLLDETKARRLAMYYLGMIHEKTGNVVLTVASYNWGMYRAPEAIRRFGKVPKETSDYVTRVMFVYHGGDCPFTWEY